MNHAKKTNVDFRVQVRTIEIEETDSDDGMDNEDMEMTFEDENDDTESS